VLLLFLYESFAIAIAILVMPLLAVSAVFIGLWHMLGMELEGLGEVEADFECAKQFVRLAATSKDRTVGSQGRPDHCPRRRPDSGGSGASVSKRNIVVEWYSCPGFNSVVGKFGLLGL
jgi:hypothetical protein